VDEAGELGKGTGNWIYYGYRGITKVTITGSDIHVDVVDSERIPWLYGWPMVYGICITSGYRACGIAPPCSAPMPVSSRSGYKKHNAGTAIRWCISSRQVQDRINPIDASIIALEMTDKFCQNGNKFKAAESTPMDRF
jgi:hypothetical protein